MTRTRSGKSLTELLVIVAVLAGLGWMLTHAVQRARAGAHDRPNATAPVSFKAPPRHARLP